MTTTMKDAFQGLMKALDATEGRDFSFGYIQAYMLETIERFIPEDKREEFIQELLLRTRTRYESAIPRLAKTSV